MVVVAWSFLFVCLVLNLFALRARKPGVKMTLHGMAILAIIVELIILYGVA